MNRKVVLLESAECDLKELRSYLIHHFSSAEWVAASKRIKAALKNIQQFPLSGTHLDLLQDPSFHRFRQSVAGHNRIIYEVGGNTIFVYAIVDTRRSYVDLLKRRQTKPSGG